MRFEEALAQLEGIVADMESGKLSLDDCIRQFEAGTRLAGLCMRKLTDTERKIEILLKSAEPDSPAWGEFTGENQEP